MRKNYSSHIFKYKNNIHFLEFQHYGTCGYLQLPDTAVFFMVDVILNEVTYFSTKITYTF